MPYPVNSKRYSYFCHYKPVNVIKINKQKLGQGTVKFDFKGPAV